MELWAVLTLILLLFISLVIVRKRQWWKNKYHYPPGPTSLPFIGNLLQIHLNDIVNSLMKLHKKYGSLYSIYLGPQRYVVLCGYETMKNALIENADAFSGRGPYPLFYNFTKGNGITFSNGEKWKQLRRFAVSALGQLGMGKRSIEERIQEEVHFLMTFFRETKGTPFDPEFCMSRSLSNIISAIVFGNRFDYEDEDFELVVHCVQNSFQIMSSTWGMLYHIYSDILDYLPGPHVKIFQNLRRMESFILRRAKKNEETLDPNCPRDYIDMFLIKMEQEKKNPCTFFNWDSLVMSTLILFFAAIESCSATLRFGFIHLLKNPEIQEKAQEEIDGVIGCNTSPSFEHKARMPYMQALIHEIQRYCDVIPLAVTHLLTQDTDFEGYKFQKGTVFIPLMTSVHFDPTQFNNPEKFDPANFLDENGCFQMKDAFMPFSAGKRFCLGAGLASMELFIYLTTILQNFKLKPTCSPEEVNACPKGIFLSNVPCPFKFSLIPR
ncbi:cytochrome P450 2F3-like [Lissotriton helveticus]